MLGDLCNALVTTSSIQGNSILLWCVRLKILSALTMQDKINLKEHPSGDCVKGYKPSIVWRGALG